MTTPELVTRVVLVGFMGAGKSTVGRRLAQALGWRFVDTDALVVERTGKSIPELFELGEAQFRAAEQDAIASLAEGDHLVIAVGGGAIAEPATRAMLFALGPTVWLDASIETLWARAGADPERPLARNENEFRARFAGRRPLYERATLRIDSEALGADEAAETIREQLFEATTTLEVPLPDRAYPIHVGPGLLGALPRALNLPPATCLVVTDHNVAGLYAEPLLAALRRAGWEVHLHQVPAGEASKSFAEAQALYDACVAIGLRRHHPIIALGGGVVGDLAGFVAATYQRGVPFVQVPTTLLAQIDSAVGGKVAINHPGGKNLIGAFYQPRVVMADTATLKTLSDREYRAGLGELVKYGVIMDDELFGLIEREAAAILDRDLPLLNRLVARSCALKAEVVLEDERESGRRAILNFGHTLGHAIEAVAGYGTILHGEAVAIGMVAAGRLAARRRLWSEAECDRLAELLERLGLPTALPALDAEALLAAVGRDKKNRDQGVTFVLPRRFGQVELVALGLDEVRALLEG